MTRKRAKILDDWIKEFRENPIVSHEILPHESITTKDHIKKLQELLVQTCIDYINHNNLTDIYSVEFNVDALFESAKYGAWQPCTDSWIRLKGLDTVVNTRKDGSTFESYQTYDIGDEI